MFLRFISEKPIKMTEVLTVEPLITLMTLQNAKYYEKNQRMQSLLYSETSEYTADNYDYKSRVKSVNDRFRLAVGVGLLS